MFQTNDPHQKEIWKYLRWKNIEGIKFRRQFWVWPYILDFYNPEKQICIEIDGETYSTDAAKKYDRERTEFLVWHWITVIRYTNTEIYENIEWVIENITSVLRNTISIKK